MKKKNQNQLILIGPMSPPLGGEALAFQMLVKYLKRDIRMKLVVIDKAYKQNKILRRITNSLRVIALTLKSLFTETNGLYLTCGQTFGGIIRDCFLILIGNIYQVPVLLHLHGGGIKTIYLSKNKLIKKILKFFYERADKIIVLGNSLRNQFYFISDQSIIEIVPNSYGKDAPKILDFEKNYNVSKVHNKLKLLYLSHVLPSKGFFDVLEALLILKRRNIPFEFNFGGSIIGEDGLSENDIQRLIDEYKLRFYVNEFNIHGYITGQKKWDLILTSNVFLLPTQFPAEGQPISIIEAMYGGCCVAVTKYRGIPDLVEEDKNGWFVVPKSPSSIADRLIWIWKHPEVMKIISIFNHKNAQRKYSPNRFLAQMIDIFESTFYVSQKA